MISIRVPASTTNLGPGFDCLGIALQLWNRITLEIGRSESPLPEMVSQAAELFFSHTGETPFPFKFSIEGDVPQARGLGSSVTLRVGTLVALDRITKRGLAKEELCALCAELEGHPDNAAAALFGGFTIVTKTTNKIARFDVDPGLRFVLFIPNFEVKTSDARAVVPWQCQPHRCRIRFQGVRTFAWCVCRPASSAISRKICAVSFQIARNRS
jgi:homoserine kinase